MSKDFSFSIVFPMLAVLLIALYGGGLGVTFIVLRETIGVEAVVVLGSALVFLVPIVAYLLTRNEPAE
jgi:Sec-independent protein secretion pathway component TatC